MNIDWLNIAYSVPAVIVGLTVHECFHAFTAYKLGDTTAKDQGRITLNPLKHIDPLGMLFIVVAGFGWAKPVQFVPGNLKNLRRDKALIAAAGPLANLLIALLAIALIKACFVLSAMFDAGLYKITVTIFYYFAYINIGLFVFNILPLPPLDGSHVFFSGINIRPEIEARIMKYGAYGLFLILIIENQMNVDIIPIGKMVNYVLKLFF